MKKSKATREWTRQETLLLLDILRTSCVSFLDGTHNNRKGELYWCIEDELRSRDPTTTRDRRQIEYKWTNLRLAYDKHKHDLETGQLNSKPCEYLEEMDDLFLFIANHSLMQPTTVETIGLEEDISYFDDEMLVEESQDYSMDEEAVVIEEIVYDSQDALDFGETAGTSSNAKPIPKRKKLTTENMDALMLKLCGMQKTLDATFFRKQLELVENEFEASREKEKEHLLQLKQELEDLKEKFLLQMKRIPDGPTEAKRRRIAGAIVGRKK